MDVVKKNYDEEKMRPFAGPRMPRKVLKRQGRKSFVRRFTRRFAKEDIKKLVEKTEITCKLVEQGVS